MSNPMDKMLDALAPLLDGMPAESVNQVRHQLNKFKDKLTNTTIIGEAGAGLVRVISDGYGRPKSVEIDDIVFRETEKRLVSDLFVAAMNDNMRRCQENAAAVEAEMKWELIRSNRDIQ